MATIPVGSVPLETIDGFGSIWVSNSDERHGDADRPDDERGRRHDRRVRRARGVRGGRGIRLGGVRGRARRSVASTRPANRDARHDRRRRGAALRDVRVRQRLGLELPGVDGDADRPRAGTRDGDDRDRLRVPGPDRVRRDDLGVEHRRRHRAAHRSRHRRGGGDDRHGPRARRAGRGGRGRLGGERDRAAALADRSRRPTPSRTRSSCRIKARSTRTRSSRSPTATCGSRCSTRAEVVRVAVPA